MELWEKAQLFIYILISGLFLVLVTNYSKNDAFSVPVLSTTEIGKITLTTAVSGGTITNDGGATVTASGVCWSINQSPSLSDNKTMDVTGAGTPVFVTFSATPYNYLIIRYNLLLLGVVKIITCLYVK